MESSSSSQAMAVPSVAVRWIVYHSTSSNVELAVLSNVSRAWRDIVVECLVDSENSKSPPDHFARLLLPSWIRHLWCANVPLSRPHDDNDDDDRDDTYCISWFPPSGIRSKCLATSRPEAEARVLCQWDGYREATDVLGPFGYSNSLLRTILEKTRSRLLDNNFNSKAVRAESNISVVRGALYARPEGYSTSWDKFDGFKIVDQPKNGILTVQRPMRKEELERLVLPKVLSRNRNDKKDSAGEVLPPFVQFLNMDSRHAIRLLTPKFKNPVFTPITVFCVAIATEDGCFFSGLGQEFAMGHMYPTTHNEAICDDRSPICLSANYTERNTDLSQEISKDVAIRSERNLPDHMRETYLDSGCDFLNSMVTEESDSDSESSDDEGTVEGAAHAVSGQLGPGAWHCYTGVFDGNQSTIRIDGEEESTTLACTIPEGLRACLDGITIGSDHSFDMSLCFGQGSDGEGEGAIAELAFFKGRLPLEDICRLESHLMAKHGISAPVTGRDERMQEDYLSRLAHKLMDQSAARAARNRDPGVSIPLRCMTSLRHVAWKQRDNVTGRRRSIIRIGGKKLSTGSTTSES